MFGFLVLLLFLFILFVPDGFWFTFIAFLFEVQILEGNGGSRLKFVNVLLDFGELFFILQLDIVENVVDEFA